MRGIPGEAKRSGFQIGASLWTRLLRDMGVSSAPTNCAASLQSLNGTAWTKRCATVLKAAHCWRPEELGSAPALNHRHSDELSVR